jgi:FkbM family methyltransferase
MITKSELARSTQIQQTHPCSVEQPRVPTVSVPDRAHGILTGGNWVARMLLRYARNFPSHRGKTRAFQALARLCFQNNMPVVSASGARLWIDPFDYIGNAICFGGGFEPLSLALACQIMSEGGVFLDVGANFGLFACCVAAQPGVDCIAIDASPSAFARLQENLHRNRQARITAVNAALGARRSLVSLVPHKPDNLGTGRIANSTDLPADSRCRVPCLPLSELLNELGVGPIRLMKIDVEGYELQVFQGFDFNSVHAPRHIIMEHAVAVADRADLDGSFRLLVENGYAPFTIVGEEYRFGREPPEDNLWWRRND